MTFALVLARNLSGIGGRIGALVFLKGLGWISSETVSVGSLALAILATKRWRGSALVLGGQLHPTEVTLAVVAPTRHPTPRAGTVRRVYAAAAASATAGAAATAEACTVGVGAIAFSRCPGTAARPARTTDRHAARTSGAPPRTAPKGSSSPGAASTVSSPNRPRGTPIPISVSAPAPLVPPEPETLLDAGLLADLLASFADRVAFLVVLREGDAPCVHPVSTLSEVQRAAHVGVHPAEANGALPSLVRLAPWPRLAATRWQRRGVRWVQEVRPKAVRLHASHPCA
mmetsp:Transcript_117478/g.332397  ORF Transcript_117478/g.332397 Transcript_117478/m.332397 type:complete len:286 (-) Transcript_117478:364-1221(-)